jgi:hypothetical protein
MPSSKGKCNRMRPELIKLFLCFFELNLPVVNSRQQSKLHNKNMDIRRLVHGRRASKRPKLQRPNSSLSDMDRPKGTHLMAANSPKYFKIEKNGLLLDQPSVFPTTMEE